MCDICEDLCNFFNENILGKKMIFLWLICVVFIYICSCIPVFVILIQICPFLQYLFVCICVFVPIFVYFIYFRLLPNICVSDHTRFIHSFLPHQQADLDRRLYLYLQACSILYFSSGTCIWYFQFCYVYLLLWLHITFLYWLLAHRPSFWWFTRVFFGWLEFDVSIFLC